jgi:ATP-dependent DNA helicase PIF1
MPDMREDEVEGMVPGAPDEGNAKTPELSFDELMAEPEPDAVDAALARDLATRAEDAAVIAEAEEVGPVACEFVCGRAGTGKSYWAKQQIAQDREWGLLAATTGIAAVNLDTTTVNSILKYFDSASLQESYLQGNLTRIIHDLALQYRRLVIDEVSMMDARQLDLIHRATAEANGYRDLKDRPLGLVVVGDFAQLPPVKAQWAFRANVWPEFASHTRRLTHVWRQDQLEFLNALDAARRGQGEISASILSSVGIQWHSERVLDFPGTTIVAKNDEVDRHNNLMLDRMPGQMINVTSRRWGKGTADAKWKNVPERLQLKVGCYVMILSNDPEWTFGNGDCGYLEAMDGAFAQVKLVRSDQVVSVPRIVRSISGKDKPRGWSQYAPSGIEGYHAAPHRDSKRKYVEEQVDYLPIRLAWASTCHKSQGLSLDRTQIDFRQSFFGSPALLYTALSRCRTLEGLRLVGDRDRFIQRCKCATEVSQWL